MYDLDLVELAFKMVITICVSNLIIAIVFIEIRHPEQLVFPAWNYNGGLYKERSIDFDYETVSIKEYTKFGKWVKKVPGIMSIPILIPYYLVVWPTWVAYVVVNSVVSLVYRILFKPII